MGLRLDVKYKYVSRSIFVNFTMFKRSRGQASGRFVRARVAVADRSVGRILAARRAAFRRRPFIPRGIVGRVATTGFFGRFQPGGPEMKFLDTADPSTVIPAAGTMCVTSLNIIPQDDTQSGRIGRKVNLRKLFMKVTLRLPSTIVAADSWDFCRIIIYQDKQTNGAAATIALLLEAATYDAYRNMANSSRFNFLYDQTHTLTTPAGGVPTGAPAWAEINKFIRINMPKLSIPLEFDNSAATGALTTQRTNNLGVAAISAKGDVLLALNCRIRYSDA